MQEQLLGSDNFSPSLDNDIKMYIRENLSLITTNIDETIKYYKIMLIIHNTNINGINNNILTINI